MASKPANILHRIGSQVATLLRAAFGWVGRHEMAVLALMLVAMLSVLAFIVLADKVVAGKTMRFDEWAVRSLRREDDLSKPIGPVWMGEVARDITALGGVAVLALLTFSIAGFFWLRRMYGAMWLVLLSTLSGLLVTTLLKSLFDRARPELVPHLSGVFTSSFPSGHSMLSATVFLTLGALIGRFVREWHLRAYFLLLAVILTIIVGISRVYLGVHYPTDVAAGWAAGLAWALICWLVARSLQRRGTVESQSDAS